MGWYVVIKTIKGHRYRYRQRTWREGKRVRTESVYLGREDGSGSGHQSTIAAGAAALGALAKKYATVGSFNAAIAHAHAKRGKKAFHDPYLKVRYTPAEAALLAAFDEWANSPEVQARCKADPDIKDAVLLGALYDAVTGIAAALAAYDRLKKIADHLYKKSTTGTDAQRKAFYAKYLRASAAVSAYQEKALGRSLAGWGGGSGQLYRKDFEAALRASVGQAGGDVDTTLPAADAAAEAAFVAALFDRRNYAGTEETPWPRRYTGKGGTFTADARLFTLAISMGIRGTTRAWKGRDQWKDADGAWYNPMEDLLQMPDHTRFKDEAMFGLVFLHELTHATRRRDRCNRPMQSRAEEEVVAELGANIVAHRLGLPRKDVRQSARYIQLWLSRCDDRVGSRVIAEREAKKAADYLVQKWLAANTTQ